MSPLVVSTVPLPSKSWEWSREKPPWVWQSSAQFINLPVTCSDSWTELLSCTMVSKSIRDLPQRLSLIWDPWVSRSVDTWTLLISSSRLSKLPKWSELVLQWTNWDRTLMMFWSQESLSRWNQSWSIMMVLKPDSQRLPEKDKCQNAINSNWSSTETWPISWEIPELYKPCSWISLSQLLSFLFFSWMLPSTYQLMLSHKLTLSP